MKQKTMKPNLLVSSSLLGPRHATSGRTILTRSMGVGYRRYVPAATDYWCIDYISQSTLLSLWTPHLAFICTVAVLQIPYEEDGRPRYMAGCTICEITNRSSGLGPKPTKRLKDSTFQDHDSSKVHIAVSKSGVVARQDF